MTDMLTLGSSFEETFNDTLLGEKGLYHFDGASIFASGETALTTFQAAGIVLLFIMMVFRLIRNILNTDPSRAESPTSVILPGIAWGIVIATMKTWVNALLQTFFKPAADILSNYIMVDLVTGTSDLLNNPSEEASATMIAFSSVSPTVFASADILKALLVLIIGILLFTQFFPMLLDTARRYIVLFFLLIFGPLFFACGASEKEKLSGIALKYSRALMNNFIGFIIKIFFITLSLTATSNFFDAFIGSGAMSAGKDYTPYQLIGLFCIVLCTYRLSNRFGAIMDALGFGPSLGFDNSFGSAREIGATPGRTMTGMASKAITSSVVK